MNKYLKYTLRTIGVLFASILIVFVGISIYVSSHKEKLIADTTQKISEQIGGKISIEDLGVSLFENFPYVAISVKNIKITDSLIGKHGHPLIQAERIFVRVNPWKLITLNLSINKVTIKNAGFYIYTDTSGYTNAYLLKGNGKTKPKKENDAELKQLLDKVELENVLVTIDDLEDEKLFDFQINKVNLHTQVSDEALNIHIDHNILIKSFCFNKRLGSFVQNQVLAGEYDLKFLPKPAILQIDSMPISISKQPFLFKAKFEFGRKQKFELAVQTADLQLDFAKTLLTKKIAAAITKIVDVRGSLKVNTTIAGSLVGGGDPYINARFESVNSTITTNFARFDSSNFKGSFLNENVAGSERNDENSKISVHEFSAKLGALQLKSDDILIINLTHPYLSADLHSDFDVNDPDKNLEAQSFVMSKGSGKIDFMYEGPIDNPTPKNTKKTGQIQLQNGLITMTASNAIISNCNAQIRIENANINLDTVQCVIGGSKILMNGKAKNVLSLIGENPEGVELDLNVYAAQLNIDHLSSIVSRKYPVKKREQKKTNKSLAKTIDRIDALLTNGKINVLVKADKLKYHSFEANQLVAKMQVDENAWKLQQASLVHGSGNLFIKATVAEKANGIYNLQSNIEMKNLDAQRIMRELNNFGIKAFSSENIKGNLTLKTTLSLNLTKKGDFDMESLTGDANFSIKNGELINFAPLMKLQNFLTKNRNMADVKFAEIKDEINFKKAEITIKRMEINSSILTIFVEGIYSQQNTDISIQLPVRNLITKKDYKPENVGTGRSGGISVFLRAKSDETGKVSIKYDPFKRFRKSPVEKK